MIGASDRRISLLQPMLRDVQELWRSLDRPARRVAVVGLWLLASGLFHVGVWAGDGGAWEGPVSWRKPIVFGVSGGLTSLSLAWVMTLLPRTATRRRLGALFAWAMGLEVLLITMQQWRGVPSHFNEATLFDGAVFTLMGLLISLVAVVTTLWTVPVFRSRRLPADVAAAARAGLALLLVAHALGYAILAHGSRAFLDDPAADPALLGAAGLMKLPHALALHGLQTLPVLAWMLGWTVDGRRQRARLVRMSATGHALVVGFAMLQMLLGRAPLDAPPWLLALPLAGLLLLAGPFVLATWRLAVGRPAFHPAPSGTPVRGAS